MIFLYLKSLNQDRSLPFDQDLLPQLMPYRLFHPTTKKMQNQNQNPNQQNQQNQNQNQDQQNQQQGQQGQGKISPQQAQQMLSAIQAKEKETQDKVNKEKAALLKSKQKEKNW